MQNRIYSERDNWDLLVKGGENTIYKCFELIGIFEEYTLQNISDDFEEWYIKCVEQRKYHYRNLGVRIVYNQLDDKYEGFRKNKYHISKVSMRHFGKTYVGFPVVVYESTYIVLNNMLEYIHSNTMLKQIYDKHLKCHNLDDYMTFQKKCMDIYISAGKSTKRTYYGNLRSQLKKLIEEDYK